MFPQIIISQVDATRTLVDSYGDNPLALSLLFGMIVLGSALIFVAKKVLEMNKARNDSDALLILNLQKQIAEKDKLIADFTDKYEETIQEAVKCYTGMETAVSDIRSFINNHK